MSTALTNACNDHNGHCHCRAQAAVAAAAAVSCHRLVSGHNWLRLGEVCVQKVRLPRPRTCDRLLSRNVEKRLAHLAWCGIRVELEVLRSHTSHECSCGESPAEKLN